MNLIQNVFPSYLDKISLLSVTISLNLYSEGSLKFFGKLFALRRKREARLSLVETHTICYLARMELNFQMVFNIAICSIDSKIITILSLPPGIINFLLSN